MKNDHKRAFGLSFGCLRGETKFEDKKESKKEEYKGEKFGSPCPNFSRNSHAISSLFQVFIMSMKCPRSNLK